MIRPKTILLPLTLYSLIASLLLTGAVMAEPPTEVTGIVVDETTKAPVPRVTVQVYPSGKASSSNDDGRFRLLVSPDDHTVEISHVAYETIERSLSEGWELGQINLTPGLNIIKGLSVYDRSYDRAQAIIIEAIRRKGEILSRIDNYRNDAYLKLVIRDMSVEDSSEIFLITESQTTVYWQQPDRYKEILTARKSSANIKAEQAIVGVGEMLNFNRNRISLSEYQIVSPTAEDALEYYNFYLLDTLDIDNTTRYLLEVEPKNQIDPLFEGTIQIIDSTYDVVTVDVGLNDGVRLPMLSDLRYQQRMAQFESTYWMPIEISFGGLLDFDIPFPGVPSKMQFEYLASLYSFQFDQPMADTIFDDYAFEITETADDFDSVAWFARQSVPLSVEELTGYARIDSIENLPTPFHKKALMGVAGASALMMGAANEIFHFNRAEGAYFGLGGSSRKLFKNTKVWGGAGYSDDLTDWQYRFGFRTQLTREHRVNLLFELKDRITKRPSVTTSSSYNSTFMALAFRYDPFDYYHEKGFKVGFDLQPISRNRLGLSISAYDQSSVGINSDYSLFGADDTLRINPAITDGRLRSLGAFWQYDSRKMIRNKGVDMPGFDNFYFTMRLETEYSSPDLLDSDFNFKRYLLAAHAKAQLLGSTQTEINLALGYSERDLPAQRLFGVDFGVGMIMSERGYNTIGDSLFSGDRIATAYLIHDLGRATFAKLPVTLINKIPFGLMLHGGALWSSIQNEAALPDGYHRSAVRPYTEAGFTLYNLTPFISPLNLAWGITWQLSDHDTSEWEMHFGVKL